MKRIGVLLDSPFCSPYLADVIEHLSRHGGVELHLILNRAAGARPAHRKALEMVRKRGLQRAASLILFAAMAKLELRALSRFSEPIRRHLGTRDVRGLVRTRPITITPNYSKSGIVARYAADDLERLKDLRFDLLIRGNNGGILKGGILGGSKDGILSFHHGDNSWNRGGPPGFWEVYYQKPATGFVIQTLTEELDGGNVVFKGKVATQKTYSQNLVHLYRESNFHFIAVLDQYVASGTLPKCHRPVPFGERILVAPSPFKALHYLFKTTLSVGTSFILRFVAGKRDRWGIAYVVGGWEKANLSKGVVVNNPKGRFFADPFVIERDGRTVCFVEDYNYSLRKACITAIEIKADLTNEILGTALEEPFHLSFPYLFEFDGNLYMVPETHRERTVAIYRCDGFPLRWIRVETVFDGISAADTMIFELNGRWWLLTNISPAGTKDHCAQLYAFHSSKPLGGQWQPHARNPIIFDSLVGRNGGLLRSADGEVFRVRQQQGFARYGSALSIAQITNLTPSSFEERQIHEIRPNFFPRLKGCHHMHSNGRYTAFDFLKIEGTRT